MHASVGETYLMTAKKMCNAGRRVYKANKKREVDDLSVLRDSRRRAETSTAALENLPPQSNC